MEVILKYGEVRADGRIFTGYSSKNGKRYPQWRKPEDHERRVLKTKERQVAANLSPEKAEHFRKVGAARNARRRAIKGDHVNSLRRGAYPVEQERILAKNAAWRKANWGKVSESRRRPQYAMAAKLRSRVIGALKNQKAKKSAGTIALIGCEWPVLLAHLEALFQPGMTWENHGQWHIDHKQPCTSFDLTLPEQQRACFHYSNLQPLWAVDNLRKGNRCHKATQ
jgi:hypothetical protein